MNKKGQALVEFVIILPIFLLLVLGVIDIGNIIRTQTRLEGVLSDVISLWEDGCSKEKIAEKLELNTLEISEESNSVVISISEDVDIITPGLHLVFDNPYHLKVSRSISYE